MRESYRIKLEPPFLQAASAPTPHQGDVSAEHLFQRAAGGLPTPDAGAEFRADRHLRRVPVPQRKDGDYTGTTMARYINGLEARLADHTRRHAPRWHDAEIRRILLRWSRPQANHPPPRWAMPRDVQAEARAYAGHLVRERITARMQRVQHIRIARSLSGYGEADPLHLLSRTGPDVPTKKNTQKM